MSQLDLLSWQPPPEMMLEPLAQPEPPNRHAIAWWEGQAAYYLRLIIRFQTGKLPIYVKYHMIQHTFDLRQVALLRLEEVKR